MQARHAVMMLAALAAGCGAAPITAAIEGPTSAVPDAPTAMRRLPDDDARAAYLAIDERLSREWDGLAACEGEIDQTFACVADRESRLDTNLYDLAVAGEKFPTWAPVFLARAASVRETFRRALEKTTIRSPLSPGVSEKFASIEAKAKKTLANPAALPADREFAEKLLDQLAFIKANLKKPIGGAGGAAVAKHPDAAILGDYARAWLLGSRAGPNHPRVAASIVGAAIVCLRMSDTACRIACSSAESDTGLSLVTQWNVLAEAVRSPSTTKEQIVWARTQLGALAILPIGRDEVPIDSRMARARAQLGEASDVWRSTFLLDGPPLDALVAAIVQREQSID